MSFLKCFTTNQAIIKAYRVVFCFKLLYHAMMGSAAVFTVSSVYNYDKSTEENHSITLHNTVKLDNEGKYISSSDNSNLFVGKYIEERKQLDYTYHKFYNIQRQLYQDELIHKFLDTIVIDGDRSCNVPEENWIVFTAG